MLRRVFLILLLQAFLWIDESDAAVACPPNQNGFILTCAFKCCKSIAADYEDYFCCGAEDKAIVDVTHETHPVDDPSVPRTQRFIAYGTAFQIDYTLLVIGLIVSIVLSVLCSFFCCLLCNGCWLHRRRNPQLYQSVNDTPFYPLCCGFGIPMGTVIFSTQPPQYRDDGIYYGSSTTSSPPTSRNRVRFNEDGTPKGVLKNSPNQEHTY